MIEIGSIWIVKKLNTLSNEKSMLLWNVFVFNLPSELEFKKIESLFLYPMKKRTISNETEKVWKYFYLQLNKKQLPEICSTLLKYSDNPFVLYPFKFICESIELIYPQAHLTEFMKLIKKLQEKKNENFINCIISFLQGLKAKSQKIISIFVNVNSIIESNLSIWKESLDALKRCFDLNQESMQTIEKSLLLSLKNEELKKETFKFISEMNQEILTTNLLKIVRKLNKKRTLESFDILPESKKIKEEINSEDHELFLNIGTGCTQTPSISFSSPPQKQKLIDHDRMIDSPSSSNINQFCIPNTYIFFIVLLTPPRKLSNIVTRSSIDENDEISQDFMISPNKTPSNIPLSGILKTSSNSKSKSQKKVQFTHNLIEEGELFYRRLQNSKDDLSFQDLLEIQNILCNSLSIITQTLKEKK